MSGSPCGTLDLVSGVKFADGQTVSNAVIATVPADGNICFYSSATTDVIVDINGWFATGSDFHGVSPVRVFDTRTDQPDGVRTVTKAKIGGATILEVKVTEIVGVVPAGGVIALSLNLEALATIIDQTEGYPYYLQKWGYRLWNNARPIHLRR